MSLGMGPWKNSRQMSAGERSMSQGQLERMGLKAEVAYLPSAYRASKLVENCCHQIGP